MVQKKNSKFSKKTKQKTKTVWFEKSFTRDLHTPLIYTEIYLVDLFLLLLQIPDDLFSFFLLFSSNPSDLLLLFYYVITATYCCCSVYLVDLLFLRPPPPTKPPNEFSVKTFFYFFLLGSLVVNYDVQGSPFRRCPFKKSSSKGFFNF